MRGPMPQGGGWFMDGKAAMRAGDVKERAEAKVGQSYIYVVALSKANAQRSAQGRARRERQWPLRLLGKTSEGRRHRRRGWTPPDCFFYWLLLLGEVGRRCLLLSRGNSRRRNNPRTDAVVRGPARSGQKKSPPGRSEALPLARTALGHYGY